MTDIAPLKSTLTRLKDRTTDWSNWRLVIDRSEWLPQEVQQNGSGLYELDKHGLRRSCCLGLLLRAAGVPTYKLETSPRNGACIMPTRAHIDFVPEGPVHDKLVALLLSQTKWYHTAFSNEGAKTFSDMAAFLNDTKLLPGGPLSTVERRQNLLTRHFADVGNIELQWTGDL